MGVSSPVIIGGTDGTEVGNTSDRLRVESAPRDGTKATYSASAVGFTPALLATDVFTITGSGTKTIKMTRIEMTGTTTAGSGVSVNLQLIKRSTADSAGTPTTDTNVPHDSTSAAATASVKHYTANPTLGTTVGVLRSTRASFTTAGAAQDRAIWDFGTRPSQEVVLRGTSEQLAVNLGTITITGPLMDINVEWTEE